MQLTDKLIDKVTFFFDSYLKGKDVLPIVRKIIDPLLTINISSYLFEKFYFKYQWLDITDYKEMLSFFVKGDFIVPISLFLVVHFLIAAVSNLIFNAVNNKISVQRDKIFLSDEGVKAFYNRSRNHFENKGFKEMLSLMVKEKNEVARTFHFIFKIIVVSIFYFCTLPHYGIALFILMLLIFICLLIIVWICYLIFDLLPSTLRKLRMAADTASQQSETK